MDIFYATCRQLIGFAFIYLICGSLIINERIKKYCYFILGLCMLLTVISSISNVLSIDADVFFQYKDTDTTSSIMSSEDGIKYYAISVLKSEYNGYSFKVRSHRTDGGNIMLYISCDIPLEKSTCDRIYGTLHEKIGIYCRNVNIYLSSKDHVG